jgi:hypothetical protein
MQRNESDQRVLSTTAPFASGAQSGFGRQNREPYIEAEVRDSDQQHVRFMIYRRSVIKTWPESESKTARLAAIESSISAIGRADANCSDPITSLQSTN